MKEISERKQELIDKFKNEPLKVGQLIYIKNSDLSINYDKEKSRLYSIVSIDGENMEIKDNESSRSQAIKVQITINHEKFIHYVGFKCKLDDKNYDVVRSVSFTLDSIMFQIFRDKTTRYKSKTGADIIDGGNFNPIVIVDGEIEYYQRPLVWKLEDKQNLIESIYNQVSCGKVLIRKRSFEELDMLHEKFGITDLYFYDIVDGKQRLNAIYEFINNVYPDMNGYYYNDLSFNAQHRFLSNQIISYAEMDENTEDKVVLEQFLKLNFAGVPQSKEHIEFVKSLYK
jgi:hypothetical protein